tara:strand:- start:1371 stop:2843 length:1473 start_codon:yes stop_codon:yes gene_type:complete
MSLLIFSFFIFAEDVLKIAVPNKFTSMKPTETLTAHNKYILPLVYDTLVKFDSDQTLKPSIAKKWTIDPKKKTVTFYLKSNIHFSNGKLLNAHHVKSSLVKICSDKSTSRIELKAIKDCISNNEPQIIIVSEHTLKIAFVSHPTVLLYQLSSPRASIFSLSKGEYKGTGPYQVANSGKKSMELEINKYYHGEKPQNKGIIFIYHSNEFEIMENLKKGKYDASLVQLGDMIQRDKLPDYNVIEDLPYISQILVFNNQNRILNNKNARLRIQHYISKNTEDLLKCRKVNNKPALGIIPKGLGGSIAHIDSLNEQPLAPPLAVSNEPREEITIHQHLGRKNKCEFKILKKAFHKAGINLKIKYHETYKTLFPKYLNNTLDGFIELFNFQNREAYSILRYFVSYGNKENFANLSDNKLDSMIINSMESNNLSERFSWYRKANNRIQDEAYAVPLYYVSTLNIYKKCLSGVNHIPGFNPFPTLKNISLENCHGKK